MGANATIIKGLYDAFGTGDVAAVLGTFDPQIQWNEAEGNPYADGNPYVGGASVAGGVFQRCVTDVDKFSVTPVNYIDGGDTVAVEGRYRGTAKATGKVLDAQFVHVWHLRGGKVVRFQQYTDTRQWAAALGS